MAGHVYVYDGGETVEHCNPQRAAHALAAAVRPGAQVVVKNPQGTTVGVGSVTGRPVHAGSSFMDPCVFPFSVPGLPRSRFYTVSVAGSNGVTVPASELGDVRVKIA